jgi:PAS domain S-box-containing protein
MDTVTEKGRVMKDEDITKDQPINKIVERAIRESEERFRKIFYSSNDAIFLVDTQADKIIDANPRACEMLGYSHDELLSMSMSAIHPQEMPILMAFSRVVSEQGYGWTNELTCLTKSGSYLPAEISASLVEFEDQTLMVAMIRDTTERKKAEELIRREAGRADALARAAARFNAHLTLESVADAVCEETTRALNASAVLFLLYDQTQGALVPTSSLGLPKELVDNYLPVPLEIPPYYALKEGMPVLISDVQSEPDLPNAELYSRFDVHTILSAGLIREKQLMGAISVYSLEEPRQFNDHELALLKGLADQATQAIDNARLRQRAERAAVATERSRLARELHDSITQSLYSLTLLAEGWRRQASAGKLEQVEGPLAELGDIAQQALKEMRLMVYELRPPELEHEGLIGALRQRLSAVEKRSGVEARLLVDEILDLPTSLENELYRIAQEALNNTLKHAGATLVLVHIHKKDGNIVLEVIDDGVGFDPSTMDEPGGMGLVSMRERVEQMGGSLEISSEQGTGTSVKVQMKIYEVSNE